MDPLFLTYTRILCVQGHPHREYSVSIVFVRSVQTRWLDLIGGPLSGSFGYRNGRQRAIRKSMPVECIQRNPLIFFTVPFSFARSPIASPSGQERVGGGRFRSMGGHQAVAHSFICLPKRTLEITNFSFPTEGSTH